MRSSSRPIHVVSSSSEVDYTLSPRTTGLTAANARRLKCAPTGVQTGPLLRSIERDDGNYTDIDDTSFVRLFLDGSHQTNDFHLHDDQDIPIPSSSKLLSTLPDSELSPTLPPQHPDFHPSQRFLPQEGSPPYRIAPWSPPTYDDPMLSSHDSHGPSQADSNDIFQPEPAALTPSPKRRTRRKSVDATPSPPKKSKPLQMTDDELNARLKECILNDPDLHLRVLRYEVCLLRVLRAKS